MNTTTQPKEISLKTNGVSHWLIVDGKQTRITRKDCFCILTASDSEVDMMLALMTGQNALCEAK